MTIYKKDGSIFKLKGPNPLTKDQNFWEGNEEIIVHNFDKIQPVNVDKEIKPLQYEEEEVIEYQEEDPIVITIPKQHIELNEEEPTGEMPPIPSVIGDEHPKEFVDNTPKAEPLNKSPFRNLERHYLQCLPAEVKVHYDALYDENRKEVSYNSPFRFQAAILKNKDMEFEFWTTIDRVSYGSIIYHPDYRRWWKIDSLEPTQENDGFIAKCTISELQPDFS